MSINAWKNCEILNTCLEHSMGVPGQCNGLKLNMMLVALHSGATLETTVSFDE